MKAICIHFAKNLLLVLMFSGLSLACLEIGVRRLFPEYSPEGRVEFQCRDGVHLGPPSTTMRQFTNTGEFDHEVSFNRYGFRDHHDLKLATENDIFVVGDSFSYGQGVEQWQRYSNLLESAIANKVFNISIPNDLDGYFRLLQYTEKQGVKINNIILGVCMENDLAYYGGTIKKCNPIPDFSWSRLITGDLLALKKLLLKHSATYSLITSLIHQNPTLRTIAIDLGLIYANNVFPPNLFDDDTQAINSSVDRIKQIIENYNALVVIIPSRGLWQGDRQQQLKTTHHQFIGRLKQRQIPYIDLKPIFEQSGKPLAFHYPKEGHWNASGHRYAADAIMNYLRRTPRFFHPLDDNKTAFPGGGIVEKNLTAGFLSIRDHQHTGLIVCGADATYCIGHEFF